MDIGLDYLTAWLFLKHAHLLCQVLCLKFKPQWRGKVQILLFNFYYPHIIRRKKILQKKVFIFLELLQISINDGLVGFFTLHL